MSVPRNLRYGVAVVVCVLLGAGLAWANGEEFFIYLRDSFDVLYTEGASAPKMMSVGLHCRLAGRPGRMMGLLKFFDHIAKHDKVWVATRADIARHWHKTHPA